MQLGDGLAIAIAAVGIVVIAGEWNPGTPSQFPSTSRKLALITVSRIHDWQCDSIGEQAIKNAGLSKKVWQTAYSGRRF
jgi:hypothetical protein